MISNLSLEVGSPTYVKTPVFRKRENPLKTNSPSPLHTTSLHNTSLQEDNRMISNHDHSVNRNYKKKRSNRMIEVVNEDDWEELRNFHTTKIEQKVGIDAHVDLIRSYLNKMTDKNYKDTRSKIMDLLNQMVSENENQEEMIRVSSVLFEIASTNRFYSKIYAELYSELIHQYEPMKTVFQENFDRFMDLFHHIEYVDPSLDYDKFCKINKDNEKRKSLSSFFINLMSHQIISKNKIMDMIVHLMTQIFAYLQQEDKKNEVDELTENVVILFQRDLFKEADYRDTSIQGMNVMELIEFLAKSKVKDFKSFTNKSLFKFMDMIDM
jgi:hypothetical protein